jgi:hypothetical protein
MNSNIPDSLRAVQRDVVANRVFSGVSFVFLSKKTLLRLVYSACTVDYALREVRDLPNNLQEQFD